MGGEVFGVVDMDLEMERGMEEVLFRDKYVFSSEKSRGVSEGRVGVFRDREPEEENVVLDFLRVGDEESGSIEVVRMMAISREMILMGW